MNEKHVRHIKDPERHDQYMTETTAQLDRLEKLINLYDFDPNDKPTLPIVMWCMKAWETADSMVSLSRTRSEHSLFLLSRSVMEYCGRAKYLSIEPNENLYRFMRSEVASELKAIDDLEELDQGDRDYKNLLESVKDKIGEGKQLPKFRQILEIIGHGALYKEYSKLSKFSHGSIHEMYKHAMYSDDNSQDLIMLKEPTDHEKKLLWYTTAYFLNLGAEALESRSLK